MGECLSCYSFYKVLKFLWYFELRFSCLVCIYAIISLFIYSPRRQAPQKEFKMKIYLKASGPILSEIWHFLLLWCMISTRIMSGPNLRQVKHSFWHIWLEMSINYTLLWYLLSFQGKKKHPLWENMLTLPTPTGTSGMGIKKLPRCY